MDTSIYLLSILLVSLRITVATPFNTAPPPPPSHPRLPQAPISFSPSSHHSIINHLPSSNEPFLYRGTITVSSRGQDQPIPVTYSLSSEVCAPLISEIPYIMTDLSQQLLSEHLDGIPFPFSSGPRTSPLAIYLAANITEQLYRSKFVLSLWLKLLPLESGLKGVGTSSWRSIIALLQQSTQELDRGVRKSKGAGLGSVLVLEAEIAEVDVLAEWRFWSVVDGLAVMCES